MTVSWKGIKGGVSRIDYTYSFNGTVSGGTFDNFGSMKTGSDTADIAVPRRSGPVVYREGLLRHIRNESPDHSQQRQQHRLQRLEQAA
jgi:hypothetical protein